MRTRRRHAVPLPLPGKHSKQEFPGLIEDYRHGMAERNGTGMFPREVMKRFPLLPLEEGQLSGMPLRENFIERVFAYYR